MKIQHCLKAAGIGLCQCMKRLVSNQNQKYGLSVKDQERYIRYDSNQEWQCKYFAMECRPCKVRRDAVPRNTCKSGSGVLDSVDIETESSSELFVHDKRFPEQYKTD